MRHFGLTRMLAGGCIAAGVAILSFALPLGISGAALAISSQPSSAPVDIAKRCGSRPVQASYKAMAAYKKALKKYKSCLKRRADASTDEQLYATGYALAKAGAYADAIDVLGMVRAGDDPRVLTMIGYSIRKSGAVADGMGYYAKALSIAPDYVEAREYLGEAHLQQANILGAVGELGEIKARCGLACEAYVALNEQIDRFVAGETVL